MSIDDEVKEILRQLSHNDYGEAIVKIENYLARYRGVVLYEDKEMSGLKMELKILEAKLGELSEEKNEYLNEISEFNTQYSLHLGEIIRSILELKKDIFYRKSILESNPLEDIQYSEEYQQYQEAKNDYNEFYHEYEEIINQERFELNEEEKAELKKLYRKASRLCHPDIVQDELKTQAIKLMQELNESYNQKNLKKVKEILSMLESGNGFEVASDKINNKQLLKSKTKDIRSKIDEVIHEMDTIKSDDTFRMIQEIEDWENYFDLLKNDLIEEKECLEKVYQELKY
jgi:hypothetical protein